MVSGHISSFLVQWLILMLSELMRLTSLSLMYLHEGVSWVLCCLSYAFQVIVTRNLHVLSMCSMICSSFPFWIIKQSSLLFKTDLILLITFGIILKCFVTLYLISEYTDLIVHLWHFFLCSVFYPIFPLVLK